MLHVDLGALMVHFNAVYPFKRELLYAVARTKLEFKIRVLSNSEATVNRKVQR